MHTHWLCGSLGAAPVTLFAAAGTWGAKHRLRARDWRLPDQPVHIASLWLAADQISDVFTEELLNCLRGAQKERVNIPHT